MTKTFLIIALSFTALGWTVASVYDATPCSANLRILDLAHFSCGGR